MVRRHGLARLVTDFAKARGATLVVGARPGDSHIVCASVSRLLRQWPRAVLQAQSAALRAELATLLPELGAPSAATGEGQRTRARQALAAACAQPVPPPMRARVAQLEGRLLLALQQPGATAAFERAHADASLAGRTLLPSLIALDHARTLEPRAALAACEAVVQRCTSLRDAGATLTARLRAAAFALDADDPDRAATHASAALDAPADIVADDLYPAERWRIAARACEAGCAWVHETARTQVEAEFRDSFLHRNQVNRDLLALAERRRWVPRRVHPRWPGGSPARRAPCRRQDCSVDLAQELQPVDSSVPRRLSPRCAASGRWPASDA